MVDVEFATDTDRATVFATANATVGTTGKGCDWDACGYGVRQMIG